MERQDNEKTNRTNLTRVPVPKDTRLTDHGSSLPSPPFPQSTVGTSHLPRSSCRPSSDHHGFPVSGPLGLRSLPFPIAVRLSPTWVCVLVRLVCLHLLFPTPVSGPLSWSVTVVTVPVVGTPPR